MTDQTYTGGCACGAIRYTATGAPVAELHCQCQHCQKRSGTGHASFAVFAGEGAVSVTGEPTTWRQKGDSGNEKIHAFCPTCGAPVMVRFAADPGITALHVGSLDAPEKFNPTLATYTSRALPWDALGAGLTLLPKGPGG